MNLNDYRYEVDYTYVKTKVDRYKEFDLTKPSQRKLYFNQRVGEEIEQLREFLKKNSFIGYFAAPKMAGKGTYTKMLIEVIGEEYFDTVSVGDLVREADKEFNNQGKDSDLYQYMVQNYRGAISLEEIFDSLVNRSVATLLPTELILTLIKRRIDELDKKTIFIDGFPRKVDQVSYSLYFRDLVNYRDDPDLFILINIPVKIIDDRMKTRRICPVCKLSRSLQFNPTSIVEHENGEVYLFCDNLNCKGDHEKLITKEGDEKGLENIKERVINDLELMKLVRKMYGIPKIEIYNAIEASKVKDLVEDYELTKSYRYEVKDDKVKTIKEPYKVAVQGREYYSLRPEPVVVQLIKQLFEVFVD